MLPLNLPPTPIAVRATVIRPGQATDLPALLALEQRSFDHDRMSRRSFARLLAGDTALWRVADSPDGVLGYALVLFRRSSRIARLYSIAIDAGVRGRGLGRTLLQAAERSAADRGADRMRLEVRPDNTAAIALYQAAGYRSIGRYPAFYEDGSDALRLEKALSAT